MFADNDRGVRSATIVTEKVKTVAQNQFNCDEIAGAQLEVSLKRLAVGFVVVDVVVDDDFVVCFYFNSILPPCTNSLFFFSFMFWDINRINPLVLHVLVIIGMRDFFILRVYQGSFLQAPMC